jgi:pilus assembly protein CpaC
MLVANHKSSTISSKFKSLKWAAFLIGAFAIMPLAGPVMLHSAAAGDLDAVEVAAENDGNFVRIGLHKSAVIRLPANAKDVIVGNPEIVDAVVRSKNTAYLFARGVGQTNIFFFDESGQQILNLDLEVAVDVTALRKLIQRSIPGTKITVDTINNSVVLAGTAPNASEAALAENLAKRFVTREVDKVQSDSNGNSIINTIKITGEDQVMLKVRVVEVQRNVLKQFGVDLQALLNTGNFALNLTSSLTGLLPTLPSSGAKGVYTGGSTTITSIVRALETDGVLKTLAEPNLTAVSGQPAKFHAGGEVPIITDCVTSVTGRVCEIEYKKFGVSLDFTPVVLSEGRINLKIKSEVSELGPEVDGRTSFTTRSAETVLELPTGGSMMLAGLIKDTTRQQLDSTPGLRKLPVLGALFRSREFKNEQTELVVIVTPYLVGSVAEKQLSTPADRLNLATDRQTILLGRLNKIYGTAGKDPDGVYHGNVGFIVE